MTEQTTADPDSEPSPGPHEGAVPPAPRPEPDDHFATTDLAAGGPPVDGYGNAYDNSYENSYDNRYDNSYDNRYDNPSAYVPAGPPSLLQRIALRIVRRPMNWLNSPWPAERVVQYLTALVVVGGCTTVMLQIIHVPLVFTNNTPTGGDMGAHVMGPAYLRDNLLSNGQLSGWSNYWYNGFPMYRFYMVVPALMIVLLNLVFPYGIAFKIVACLGIVSLPFCCWAFGRLARFRYPLPELFALAALLFLFDESFTIYGGNVPSTMAGEFSFSIALSFGILGLGLFARGLETGKHRNWTAIVIALSMLSHGIVLIFVALAMLLMWLVWMDKTRFIYGLTTGLTAVALSGFWVLPFVQNHAYMTDMKYRGKPDGSGESFWMLFFDLSPFWNIVVTGFALVGFFSSVARRHLNGAWLGITCFALVAMVFLTKESLPVIGLLWNVRLLPFFYLLRFMLMMVGIYDTVEIVQKGMRLRQLTPRERSYTGLAAAAVILLVVGVVELFFFKEMPGARETDKDGQRTYSWGIGGWDPINVSVSGKTDAYSDGWTRYNFMGYEGRDYYGEYHDLVMKMDEIGKDPDYGCGRALWEVNGENGLYGTTMALMLLPHWTNGCIASEEGLFFEASGTTPYHFLTAAAMSANSSNPVRELRYVDNNAAVGVPLMQKMGVDYLMVFTEAARAQADARGDLSFITAVGPWKIYEVADSEVVVPLTVQPVVVNGRGGDQRERNLELGTSWFQNPEEWAAIPADDGPAEWQRIDVAVDMTRRVGNAPLEPGRKVDIVVPADTIEPVQLPANTVTNFVMGDQDLSFDVTQIGVPVLVKVSYFPNWQVEGADGPYRIAPNFMVVVPTSTHVYMHYDSSSSDYVAYLVTLLGIGLLVFWRVKGDVVHRSAHPFLTTPMADDWSGPAGWRDEPTVWLPDGSPPGWEPGGQLPGAGPAAEPRAEPAASDGNSDGSAPAPYGAPTSTEELVLPPAAAHSSNRDNDDDNENDNDNDNDSDSDNDSPWRRADEGTPTPPDSV
ncbi:MAG: hypothetical protein Q7V88_02915 [Actinomycetota bacterium]|nr:hypothetical protein [Actinomycetota bacterium]